jgi:hypothetical protein
MGYDLRTQVSKPEKHNSQHRVEGSNNGWFIQPLTNGGSGCTRLPPESNPPQVQFEIWHAALRMQGTNEWQYSPERCPKLRQAPPALLREDSTD